MAALLFSTSLDNVDTVYTSVDIVDTYEKPQRESWQDYADCATTDPEIFFPPKTGDGYRTARRICKGCNVQQICLDYAMRMEDDDAPSNRYGMFAGKTPVQRYALFKKQRDESENSQESQTL